VRSKGVVVFDGAVDSLTCSLEFAEGDVEPELDFEDTVDPLGDGIFVEIAILRHGDGD